MKRYFQIIILLVALFSIQAVHVNRDKLYEIAKHLEIFTNVYKELNTNYVDDLDPAEMMKTAIDAMVSSLDPYTNYISESQIEQFRISTEGKYSGIGAVIREIDSVLTLIEAHENGPALKAGLKPGDQILSVNGESTRGKTGDEIGEFLRGAPGTEISLEVKSYGDTESRFVTVYRGEIDIPNVPHYELVDGSIGYVHLSKFTENAGANVRDAIRKMQQEKPLDGLILDLRSNGGGLLREAIAVTNVFIDKDVEVVSTKGKVFERDRVYKTTQPAMDTGMPLIVLIDNRSASASEIVSGAVQDLDRGLLVGQKSFGKGLVQNTAKVGYNAQLKLTTAKYYIPSGRCIQSVAYKNGEPVDIPDGERNAFKTRNGRKVLDGGGVKPDVPVEVEKLPEFVSFLLRKQVVFRFVHQYQASHDSIQEVEQFYFSDFDAFRDFYRELDLPFESRLSREFKEFESALESENKSLTDTEEMVSLRDMIQPDSEKLLDQHRELIIREIEKEIVGRYYFERGKIQYSLKNDPELNAAIRLLRDTTVYNSILSGNDH